jgi:hypothetical protein
LTLSCLFLAPLKAADTDTRDRSIAVFDSLVCPAAEACGYPPVFCKSGEPGTIFEEVVDKILNAQVIVADLTGGNGSLMYELGFAHTRGIATVLLIQSGYKPPFDVQTTNMIFYNYDGGRRTLASSVLELREQIRKSRPPHPGASNPILNAERVRRQRIEQLATRLTPPPNLFGQQPPPVYPGLEPFPVLPSELAALGDEQPPPSFPSTLTGFGETPPPSSSIRDLLTGMGPFPPRKPKP